MAKITIKNFGPIQNCEMDIKNLTILTGSQASGKSTIAKCIYFFRTIKDDVYDILMKKSYLGSNNSVPKLVYKGLRSKFLQIFGTSQVMDNDMKLKYEYCNGTYVEIHLEWQRGEDYISPNFIVINYSENIFSFLQTIAGSFIEENIKDELNKLFNDDYDTIFIPAGRSLISLLTSQLNYLFATMDDEQKRSIDYCTQKYIERILKIRPLFANGLDGLVKQKSDFDKKTIKEILRLINLVLKGRYVFVNGEERLYLTDNHDNFRHYVKINFTSSGQQETVWIFNILFHLLINRTKAFIILEEPEAHLYPDAQMIISDILALITNNSCNMLITTHSPYILGEFNNLIYAGYLSNHSITSQKVDELVDEILQIKEYNAFFVVDGDISPCIENSDEKLIINEVIDGASGDINKLYDKLFDIGYNGGGNNAF